MEEMDGRNLDGIAFLGNTLGPLFYYDPSDDAIAPTYSAIAAMDVEAAGAEWPFADGRIAADALALMSAGCAEGVDDGLVWEYRRLFVGPQAKAAPPWGSVYTDRECVVFGEATLELRQWMRESGIRNLGQEKEPEDHIGLLLMLMAWISENKPELLDDFLGNHVLTWSTHFLDLVESQTEHSFFTGLAQITRESLEGIQAARGIDVQYPRYYR